MLKTIWRKYASYGLKTSLTTLRNEFRTFGTHRKGVQRARRYKHATNLSLNIACGSIVKAGWLNIDICPAADLRLDLREKLPLPDGCAQMIYCEHFLEHLDYPEEASRLLGECKRLLAPGGRLSIVVPDIEYAIHIYTHHHEDFRSWLETEFHTAWQNFWIPAWCDTAAHVVSYIFHQNSEHKHLYDASTLERVLTSAGFAGVRARAFEPGLDSPERERGCVYMDATK